MARRFGWAASLMLGMAIIKSPHPGAADVLRVYAAGSLSEAFTEMVDAFAAPAGSVAAPVFGPSGLLRDKIEHGAPADILASADMEQPRILSRQRGGRPVVMFTRNRLCALGRNKLGLNPDNLLDRLLDPAVRLATSTPGADPAGDYTWAVFARAEAVHPGAQAVLQSKALQLFGGPATLPLVPGHGPVQGIFLADRADVVVTYCSGSEAVMREVPGVASVALPAPLTVGPAYGLIVLTDQPLAARFALFVMSEQGQMVLLRHGFDAVGVSGR